MQSASLSLSSNEARVAEGTVTVERTPLPPKKGKEGGFGKRWRGDRDGGWIAQESEEKERIFRRCQVGGSCSKCGLPTNDCASLCARVCVCVWCAPEAMLSKLKGGVSAVAASHYLQYCEQRSVRSRTQPHMSLTWPNCRASLYLSKYFCVKLLTEHLLMFGVPPVFLPPLFPFFSLPRCEPACALQISSFECRVFIFVHVCHTRYIFY